MNPFQEWIESETGKKCADYSTLRPGRYLSNRLYHAFYGGLLHEKPKIDQLQTTLEYYEQRVRKLKAEIQEKDHQLQELRQLLSKA